MSVRKHYVGLRSAVATCLLAFSTFSRGELAGEAVSSQKWRDLGALLLTRVETGYWPPVAWLDRQLGLVDRDSELAVEMAEFILINALDDCEQHAPAKGRIPLDVNPQCLLGLYFMDRFPRTQLGDWGRKRFEQCIEHACMVAMPGAGSKWRAQLQADLLSGEKTSYQPLSVGTFAWTEAPYLYFYLACRASSVEARHKARRCLAHYLWERWALEPGLRQYLILADQGCQADGSWLPVLAQLDKMISHQRLKKLYRQILERTDSTWEAQEASQRLARLLLAESRPRDALATLGILFQRFPDAECTASDVRQFWEDYRVHREEVSRRLIGALTRATQQTQVLELCRFLDALWTSGEALQQWEVLVSRAELGSLMEQLGRVFWARAVLHTGNTDGAQAIIRGLTQAEYPLIRAQSVAVSAEIAQCNGNLRECIRLYSEAILMDRPTSLPDWYRDRMRILALDEGTSSEEPQVRVLFLRGYHNLIDGDFAAAADSLGHLTPHFDVLPSPLHDALPCALMLAHLGVGDSTEAEAWGRRVIEGYRQDNPDNDKIASLLEEVAALEMTICQSVACLRNASADPLLDGMIEEQAVCIFNDSMRLDSSGSRFAVTGNEVFRLYVHAKRQQIARTLTAEYRYLRQQGKESEKRARSSSLEPLLFVAQVLGGDSFTQIQENLAVGADTEEANGWMYRFALFAERLNRPDLARSAMDAVAREPISATYPGVLEDIAHRYLAASNYLKAIDAYRAIVLHSRDPNRAESAQFKIISIYAESLTNYNEAIREGESFTRMYPGSTHLCHVEFLLGKLAYLNKDYARATGQLDGFRKRYPQHSQVGQAMLLAGLGRMGEGNTKEAIGRFTEIIQRYPERDVAARSKFLIGYAHMADQQYQAAMETFKQLVEQFPDSRYVAQARSLIDRLSKVSQ